jgi:putative SbcD/Mre11-related phosphoesterase
MRQAPGPARVPFARGARLVQSAEFLGGQGPVLGSMMEVMPRTIDDWLLTAQRVAVHRPTGTAVAADLHLGYARARRRGGEAVPETSLADLLTPLLHALAEHGAGWLVVAGDLFEAGAQPDLAEGFASLLRTAGVELLVVAGNHDRGLARTALPVVAGTTELGDWRVVHGDATLPDGPVVQGHVHPCLRVRGRAVPCYLVGERRLVLPAYSAEAAGVDVRGGAWDGFRCHAVVGGRVLDLGDVGDLRGLK